MQEFFSFNFPLPEYFFFYFVCPPPPHKFSNGPSLNVTCPVACAHKMNTKISSSLAKAVQEVKKRVIVHCAESLNQYAEDRGYQLCARLYKITQIKRVL